MNNRSLAFWVVGIVIVLGQISSSHAEDLPGTIQLTDVGSLQPGLAIGGEAWLDYAGWSVSSAGDINGDGIDEVLIASLWADHNGTNSGSVTLLYGRSGTTALAGTALLSNVASIPNTVLFVGPHAQYFTGSSVAPAGDVNGDGYDDLLIGAAGAPRNGLLSGAAYLVYGSPTPLPARVDLSQIGSDIAGAVFYGEAAGDRVGLRMQAGDTNGDGLSDLLFGSERAGGGGKAYLVYGQQGVNQLSGDIDLATLGTAVPGALFHGTGNGDLAGQSVAVLGDTNGDGLGDLLISAPAGDGIGLQDNGLIYLIYGRPADSDPLIGSYSLDDVGSKLDGVVLEGTYPLSRAGAAISNAGDVNGDGAADFMIGTVNQGPNGSHSGQTYLVYGPGNGPALPSPLSLAWVGSTVAGAVFNGMDPLDRSSEVLAPAGDLNDDGLADLLIGAPGGDGNATDAGEFYLIYGRPAGAGPLRGPLELSEVGLSIAGTLFHGALRLDRGPNALAAAGDFNGDGADDLVVGVARGALPGHSAKGTAYIIYGIKSEPMNANALIAHSGSGRKKVPLRMTTSGERKLWDFGLIDRKKKHRNHFVPLHKKTQKPRDGHYYRVGFRNRRGHKDLILLGDPRITLEGLDEQPDGTFRSVVLVLDADGDGSPELRVVLTVRHDGDGIEPVLIEESLLATSHDDDHKHKHRHTHDEKKDEKEKKDKEEHHDDD